MGGSQLDECRMADCHSYSLVAYEDEFAGHPDIVATWAVNESFLARFNEGFQAYRFAFPQQSASALLLKQTRT